MESWTTQPPTEPGTYWLYGDAFLGLMNGDFREDAVVKVELYLVEVHQVSNGLIAVTNGNFMSLRTFDKGIDAQGHVGYWQKTILPDLPDWQIPGFGVEV